MADFTQSEHMLAVDTALTLQDMVTANEDESSKKEYTEKPHYAKEYDTTLENTSVVMVNFNQTANTDVVDTVFTATNIHTAKAVMFTLNLSTEEQHYAKVSDTSQKNTSVAKENSSPLEHTLAVDTKGKDTTQDIHTANMDMYSNVKLTVRP